MEDYLRPGKSNFQPFKAVACTQLEPREHQKGQQAPHLRKLLNQIIHVLMRGSLNLNQQPSAASADKTPRNCL